MFLLSYNEDKSVKKWKNNYKHGLLLHVPCHHCFLVTDKVNIVCKICVRKFHCVCVSESARPFLTAPCLSA